MRVTGTQIFKDAISYFLENMRGILLAAAIPALIGIALAVMLTNAQTDTMIQQLRDGVAPEKLNPFSLKFVLLGVIAWLVGLWFSARVYRYRLSQEFPVTCGELSAVMWMAGYMALMALMLVMLIILFVFVAVLVIGIISIALGATPQGGAPNPQLAALIGFLVLLVILPAYLYGIYAAFRFAIAFPGIAIGRREHIIHGMWPMARGVTLPLLAWFFLTGIGMLLILALLIYATVGFSAVLPLPEMHQRMLEDPSGFSRTQLTGVLIMAIPQVLFRAFGATVMAEAYAQINRGRAPAVEQVAQVETPQDGGWR